MSTKSTARRAAAVAGATGAAVASSLVIAGPASANVPQGWEPSHMSPLGILTFILFIPLGVAIVVSLLVLLPGVMRGEKLIPTENPINQAHLPARLDQHGSAQHSPTQHSPTHHSPTQHSPTQH